MIAIVNITEPPFVEKEHIYRIQINDTVITYFKHIREEGLAQCLRNAAKAVDKQQLEDLKTTAKMFEEHQKRRNDNGIS